MSTRQKLDAALDSLEELHAYAVRLEDENEALKAKLALKPADDDPLTVESYTFAQQHRQIDDLKAEVRALRKELSTRQGVESAALKERDEALEALVPLQRRFEEVSNKMQALVRSIDKSDAAHVQELAEVRDRGYAKVTELEMAHRDRVEALEEQIHQLESDLTRTTHERDVFANKLQVGLRALTEAIDEVRVESGDDT